MKRQVLVANGLWPMPNKTPLNAVVHGKVERDGYTVERVSWKACPDTTYAETCIAQQARAASMPAVLCPHGHWRERPILRRR